MGAENWELGTCNWELRTGNCLVVVGGGAMKSLLTDQVISGQIRGLKLNHILHWEECGQLKIGQKGE